MSRTTIFDNEFVTVEYVPDKSLIHHTIHKPIGDRVPMFMEAMNAGTEALRKYGASKWLSDDRKNGPLDPRLSEWGAQDWNPRTVSYGWKYWANVVPQEIESAGTLIPIIEDLHKLGLRMQVFTTVEEALAWLDKQK